MIKYAGFLAESPMAGDSSEEAEKRRQSPPPVEFVRPSEAQGAAPPRDQPPAAWVPRPEDYQVPPGWAGPAARPVGPSNLPKIAAVFLLLSGILGMAGAIINAVSLPSVSDYANFTNSSPEVLAVSQICGLISIWSQALAILGGVMAWQRMNWKLTLVCAIFALFTLGYFLVDASLVGLVGLILTVLARRYFAT